MGKALHRMTKKEAIEKLIELAYEYFDEIDTHLGSTEFVVDRTELDEAARIARS
jgi:hypothetical protein